jgi:hypothetical protein
MEGWLEAFEALGLAVYDAKRQCWHAIDEAVRMSESAAYRPERRASRESTTNAKG